MPNSKNPLAMVIGPYNPMVINMFYDAGWRGTRDPMMADLLVFTGGADISPSLYHEKPITQCGAPDLTRDKVEREAFDTGKNFEIPMVGICRGAQILNALNGGRLWQDVDGHRGNHKARDLFTNEIFEVTSTHHQMMRPTHEAVVIAIAEADPNLSSLCTYKRADGIEIEPSTKDIDPEVVFYESTKSLCFQPHPEYNSRTDTPGYFWSCLNKYILDKKAA